MNPNIALRSSVMVLAALLSCCFGCARPEGDLNEREAIAAIMKLGGKVEFGDQDDDRRVVKVYLHNTPVADADLVLLGHLAQLRNLFLGKTKIGDAGLEHLRDCGELQTLSLNSTRVTDDGLVSLAKLTKLKTLNLQETQVTAAGVARLRKSLPSTTVAR